MRNLVLSGVLCCCLGSPSAPAIARDAPSPDGLAGEQSLPSRYPYVVQDVLRYCRPAKGFWVDLGAGKGQVAIPLVEATGNPVVMLDPDKKALAEGLRIARQQGLQDRLSAVVGVAEEMPFPDNSVDLVVSRGSIFFWKDPVKGLQEVHRVLRPGGKAYIGGGAGSGYPQSAADKLIQDRREKIAGEEAEKWKRFVELRRPEQMHQWAQDARLPQFTVMGQGALSADDPWVGQGVWLLFAKPDPTAKAAATENANRANSTGRRRVLLIDACAANERQCQRILWNYRPPVGRPRSLAVQAPIGPAKE
jgi:SAM-dependent methyltransferase